MKNMKSERKILETSIENRRDKKKANLREHLLPHGSPYKLAACTKCHLIYNNNKWFFDEELFKKESNKKTTHKIVCSACAKINDNHPDGILLIKGEFLLNHIEEIKHIAMLEEKNARERNPFDRVIKIMKNNHEFMITTTDDRFTQRIARLIHKTFKTDLTLEWLHEEKFVRAMCYRNE